MTSFLFIGGPLDGKRNELPDGGPSYVHAPVNATEDTLYIRVDLLDGIRVYRHDSITIEQLVAQLVTRYPSPL